MLQDLDHTVSDDFETKSITKTKSKDKDKSETKSKDKDKSETEEDEKSTKVFIRADLKAQAHIRLRLSDRIIELIKDEISAKAIISKLDSLYDRQNIVSIALLEEEYSSRKIKSNEKLQDYLNDLDRIRSNINAIQPDSISKFKHVVRILNGLAANPDYKNVVSSLYTTASQSADEVSVEYVTSRLLDECRLFNLDSDKSIKNDKSQPKGSAMSAHKKTKKTSKPYKCWSCGNTDPQHNCTKQSLR